MVQRKSPVRRGLTHVHRKLAKGKEYFYFNTGQKKDGKPILTPLPDIRSPEFARAYQAALAARSRRSSVRDVRTFEWLVNAYQASAEWKKLAEKSRRNYARHLGYAAELFRSGDGLSWPIGVLKAEHVVALRDRYTDRPGTANACVRAVGSLYAWAKKVGRRYVTENIAHEIEELEGGEHQPWPEDLVEAALADPEMRLPVGLLYFTGQRISDVVKLGRPNMARGLISLTQQKTGVSLRIAVHSRLAAIIEADAPPGELLFLVGEQGRLTESGLRQRIQKWAAARGHKVVPHGLRKNAVNALLEAGCSTAEVSAITGQSLKMIEHYAKERDKEHLSRSAVLKFEQRNRQGA